MGAGAGAEQLKENEKVHAKLIIEWHCLCFLFLDISKKNQGESEKKTLTNFSQNLNNSGINSLR